ncbi:MAG: AEC family transporter [Lachnospiraceae bacterium]|nr:AEC family transporter [Lachnospiraceae bacterium]
MMFAEMLTGYLLCRMNILRPKDRTVFSKSIINLFLPCNIINSFLSSAGADVMHDFLVVLVISIAIQIFCAFLANILYNRKPADRKPILQYATVCSNAGFLGNAVAEGVYGGTWLALWTDLFDPAAHRDVDGRYFLF